MYNPQCTLNCGELQQEKESKSFNVVDGPFKGILTIIIGDGGGKIKRTTFSILMALRYSSINIFERH